MSAGQTTAMVLDIQRFCVGDGPGIRTTVFLKGCPLRCAWCHNPESQSPRTQLMLKENLCTRCGVCGQTCPQGLHRFENHKHSVGFDQCRLCGECARYCCQQALSLRGKEHTAAEVVTAVLRDAAYYAESGGGLTFSGGEPLLYPDFLEECMRLCEREGIGVWLDTCGYADRETFRKIAARVHGLLYDIKIMDSQQHRRWTGQGNELILDNFKTAVELAVPIVIRVPVIAQVNDGQDHFSCLAAFLNSFKQIFSANCKFKLDTSGSRGDIGSSGINTV